MTDLKTAVSAVNANTEDTDIELVLIACFGLLPDCQLVGLQGVIQGRWRAFVCQTTSSCVGFGLFVGSQK